MHRSNKHILIIYVSSQSLVESCNQAKRLRAFDQEYSRQKQQKVDVKGKRIRVESCPNLEARLGNESSLFYANRH